MSQLDEFNQNNLLFKRFQGVIQTNIINPNSFNNEFGKPSLVNTYNDTIFSSNVSRDLSSNTTVLNLTLQLPGAPSVIDTTANSWQTGVYGEYADLKTADNIAIMNLKFYQKVFLKSISSGPYAWWLIDPSLALPFTTNNLLKDMIPFSYGTTGATYSPVVWYYIGSQPVTATQAESFANDPNNWTPDFNQNSTPLYWLVDYASGVLQFYAQADSNGHISTTNGNKIKPTTPNNYIGGKPDPTSVPRISFIKYIGDKGAASIGGGSDISAVDISNIQMNLDKLNRMILPDGYVDISGTDYDLCGNEVVRTYYTYNRAQMFVGYDNLPILDGSAVNHSQDPSHNNIKYELDVSGNFFINGNIDLSYNKIRDVSSIIFRENIDILTFDSSWNKSIYIGNLDENTNDFSGNRILVGSDRYPIHIGYNAGPKDLSGNTIAIGREAGANIQFANSIAIGREAGQNQHDNTIAIGRNAGLDQSANGIAIGRQAGKTQKVHSIAIGREAGQIQYDNSIAIGRESGLDQSANSIAIGREAGKTQKFNSIAIGREAGQNQHDNSIAIGRKAGVNQSANSIILNAQGNTSLNSNLSGLYIAPIRGSVPDTHLLYYNNSSKEITYGNWKVSGDLDLSCNNIIDVSNIYFCNRSAILGSKLGQLDISGSINVTGNADIDGYAQVSENLLVATDSTDFTSAGVTDYNAYFRQTNIIDTMKLPFITYFDGFWLSMANRTITGQNIWRQGDPCPFGPNLIPIAKIDINGSYLNSSYPATQDPSLRPLLANTIGYFTVKFAQPSMSDWIENSRKAEFSTDGTWLPTMGSNGTKPGYNCIPEQTIHFVAGYQEQQYNTGGENRNPKPFIKILSCSFGDIRNVNGKTIIFTNSDPVTNAGGAYTGEKIGGITRIIIAEGEIKLNPGQKGIPIPVDDTPGKAWLFLEQTWAYEGWMLRQPQVQEEILRKICGDHNIEVRLYSNNTGAKMPERANNPFEMKIANDINTDWQLLSNDLMKPYIQNWQGNAQPSFLLGGLPGSASFPPTGFSPTLFVGGQQNPSGLTIGIGETQTPQLWFIDLNVYNWPYGITTTKEIFKNDLDICGNVIIDGTTNAQAIFATDITCNNLDALNSIDVGANQELTITQSNIVSTTASTGFNSGLKYQANNFYYTANNAGIGSGFIINLNNGPPPYTDDKMFRIMRDDNNFTNDVLFSVGASGVVNTTNLRPLADLTYDIGFDLGPGSSSNNRIRYNQLHIKDISCSGDILVRGNAEFDGNVSIQDLSATNIDVSNNLNVLGHTLVTDLSATNIDVSNNLNVEGLITGVGETVFVEYRDYTADIDANTTDWYCIARTKDTTLGGGADNARGLFIVDDNTSGRRQQIIFYAGTAYSRGNYINVIANNWYGSTPTITKLKLETGGIYQGTNLYVHRQSTTVADRVYVRLYQNTRAIATGGQWELTATPIANLTTTSVNLDLTYNPNNQRANSCSSLDHSFQGNVLMNTLSLSNLDVQNTINTKILEVEDSTGNNVLKVDGPNKTSTFYFNSNTSSGSLILKDTSVNTSTFIKQQGTTVVMEGSDLQVGSVGVEKDINAGEVTGWFNTRDYFAVAKVIGTDSGGGMPQPLYMSQITNNCPGTTELITTSGATNSIQPQATGIYTVTITGVWTGSGNPWNDNSDTGQPMILMYGPAYHTSAPGGITTTQMLSLQSSSRFYNSGYTDYLSFNWTGRMVHQFNNTQAQYSFYCKENGGGSSGTQTYTGQLQVTRIC